MREMKARIKEDDSSVPAPDGPFEYFSELRHGRPVSAGCAASRAAAARNDPARRQQGGRGQALLAARRRGAQPGPQAAGLCGRRQGLGALHASASATWRPGKTCPTRSPTRAARSSGRATAAPCSTCASTPISARCSSIATASARRRPTMCWSTRRRTSASTSASARRSRARSSPSIAHDHQTTEVYLIDADAPDGARGWSRRASTATSMRSSITATA